MSTTILLVSRGSRDKEGNKEVTVFLEHWRKMNPQSRFELCFTEFADILLDEGLDSAAKGAKRVIIVPLLLNAEERVKMAIPTSLAIVRKLYPKVEFSLLSHSVAAEVMLNILKRSLQKVSENMLVPDPKTTGVILLGEGTLDRVANSEIAKLARWLFEETEYELIDIAFTDIAYPRLETVVQRQVKLGMTQIAILPYYLFTDTLIKRMGKQLERLQVQYPQISLGLGHYLGFEQEIYDYLDQKVVQFIEGAEHELLEYDGSNYQPYVQQKDQKYVQHQEAIL